MPTGVPVIGSEGPDGGPVGGPVGGGVGGIVGGGVVGGGVVGGGVGGGVGFGGVVCSVEHTAATAAAAPGAAVERPPGMVGDTGGAVPAQVVGGTSPVLVALLRRVIE